MKLQSKVLIVLASLWVLVCLIILADAKFILKDNYKNLEEALVLKDVSRAKKALESSFNALSLYTTSFSQWDDAYDFMKKKSQRFIDSNFVPGTFTSSKINFFIFYDTTEKFYYGQAYDLIKNEYMAIPPSLLAFLNTHPSLTFHPTVTTQHTGIIKIDEGYVVLSQKPVLTSDGKGPPLGVLLMGYFFNTDHMQTLSQTVEMKLSFLPLPLTSDNTIGKEAHKQLLEGKPFYLVRKDAAMDGYILVNDIDNQPIGLLQVSMPRDIYSEALFTVKHYFILVGLLGLLILFVTWFLLKKFVLDRVLNVSKEVIDINSQAKFSQRIKTDEGQDEISYMVNSLNSMLELIELTQDQLKYRISRRTQELEKLARFNKNLFYELNSQKNIESKLREDEKKLRQMAYYDHLTGLPNRALFTALLEQAVTQANLQGTKVAILFLDIDNFKKINDTYGHDFGDKFIKVSATRLREAISSADIVSRLSGDEFIIFLTNINDDEMIDSIVDRIFAVLTQPVTIDQITLTPMYSIGISIYPDDSSSIDSLFKQADLAMYHAKRQHSNIYCYFKKIETQT